jgi:hypothetical protein
MCALVRHAGLLRRYAHPQQLRQRVNPGAEAQKDREAATDLWNVRES